MTTPNTLLTPPVKSGANAVRRLLLSLVILAAVSVCADAQTYTPAFSNIEYANVGGVSLKMDIYMPTPPPVSMPVVVWIHGGAWNGGDKYPCDAAPLISAGYAVVSPNYRFCQAYKWPAQIYDCKSVIRWIRANASLYRLDGNHIAVWGISAGGHLAAMLGTTGNVAALEGTEGFTGTSSRVQAVVTWAAPTHLTTMGSQELPGSVMHHDTPDAPEALLLGCQVPTCPDLADAASPVTYASSDDPPFLIMHGTQDLYVPPLQAQELNNRLVAAGVVDSTLWYLPYGQHGGAAFTAQIPAVQNWLDRHLKTGFQANASTMADVCRSLGIAAGFNRSSPVDISRLANPAATRVDLAGVVRQARRVAGLSANP